MSKVQSSPGFFPCEEVGTIRLLKVLKVRKNAEVWCGADLESGKLVAVKFLYPEFFREEHFSALTHFLQGVDSPAIIQFFHSGTTVNGFPYIVMEYASKGSLRSFLKRCRHCTFAQNVYLLRQMLKALCVLHSNGVVHRDLKPENILIAENGSLRLNDFGIARFPGVAEASGKVFGTARYCAPEQAVDSTKVDSRSDLYALGVILFETLTGTPFREEDSFSAAGSPRKCSREFLNEFATDGFTGLLAEMLEFFPADRPSSPQEVLEKLDEMELPESSFTSQI
jgi:serine/threonine-protein kinase